MLHIELMDMADEMLCNEVFSGPDGLFLNSLCDDSIESSRMADSIVQEMAETALSAAQRSMRDVLELRKGDFIKQLTQEWACPDCSDQLSGQYVTLARTPTYLGDKWVCPICGCTTSYPKEDGCFDMSEV